MITGRDVALIDRLRELLANEIARRTQALITVPTDGLAGHIRGLQSAMMLLDEEYQRLSDEEAAPRDRRTKFPHDELPH